MDKPNILIVDDEHANQFLLDGLLSANGYNTYMAANGEECLSFLQTQLPDLILLDIMMPKMTGIQVLEKINLSEELRAIPVIMVSAKTATPDIEESLSKGAIDYIKKPFNETELLARVKVGIRLKKNEDRLREMVRQREDFVRIISHDLRSPFAAINGFAEMIVNDENLTAEQKESLTYIIESVEFSLEYFNKLLNWSHIEHRDIILNRKNVALERLVALSIRIFKKKAQQKEIELINEVDPCLYISLDSTYFQQVISNLLNNAVKYCHKGGKVVISSVISKDESKIYISDTGIGIPEEFTPEMIFNKGFVDSRRGTNGEAGTGIGLGICKKIIDAHGFGITFNRKPEGGTDFVISMSS